MRFPGIFLGVIGFITGLSVARPAESPILSPEELAILDRESAMWRAVRADLDVTANIEQLGKRGFGRTDLDWFRPKLEQVWKLPGSQGLGLLSADVRERIAEVEKDLVRHYRNSRRFEEAGVRPTSDPLYTRSELNVLWRRALIQALSYEEMRDYGLARSAEAERVERLTKGLPLTTIERRELVRLAREFGDRDGTPVPSRIPIADFQRSQLDYYDRIRDLLGAEHFVTYLERANDDFLALRQCLAGQATSATALALFRLRQKTAIAVHQRGLAYADRQRLGKSAREEAAQLLGPDVFSAYANTEHGRWMFPR